MIPFYLTFVAVVLSGLASRDQVTIASITRAQGQRPLLLILAILVSIATAAFAGWAASQIIPLMQPDPRVFLCAMAVLFAGAESLVLAPRGSGREPTRSAGAFALVMLFHQLTDAARFIVFGIAVAAQASITAAAGGALGGIVLVAMGWAYPGVALAGGVRIARRLLGVAFILIGAYIAMRALDWI
jgi:Ca2+/H+ antiporter, TMEM165/GDT1 family